MNEAEELLEELKQFDEGPPSYVVCSRCGDKTEVVGAIRVFVDGHGGLLCGPCWLREGAP